MIKGIARIKGLGVYSDYVKPKGTLEFGSKNLIYGWNYSGKTTLSRLFAQIENSDEPNPDLEDCSFTFETDGDPITERNYAQSSFIVRVFNSDFVRDNLNFTGQSFKPILLLGKDADTAQKQLDHYEGLSVRVQEKARDLTKRVRDSETAFATAKTATAADIKRTLGLVKAYTATHLTSDITDVLILDESQLQPEDKLRDDLRLALISDGDRPNRVDRLFASPSIEAIHKEAVEVLAATPSLATTIKHLEENPVIERWVESGLSLHSDLKKCEFCDGELDQHRIANLKAHFSKDLADHKSQVEQLYNKVMLSKVQIQLPPKAEFNPQFRDVFSEASKQLLHAVEIFNNSIDILATDVQRKINAPFKVHEPTPLTEGLAGAVIDALEAVNEVIDANNLIVSNFDEAKREAITRVKRHYVQEFVDKQEKLGTEVKRNRLKAQKDRLDRFTVAVTQQIEKLQALISQAQFGREEINRRLVSMLGSEAVQITVVPEGKYERFQLVRKCGGVAKNLSDGEKTAIAFCYFLTKLKELNPEQFKDAIIYIDDPISSLDANHIFQVTAAIRDAFFSQEQDGAPWLASCKQIFISTHNFEFFQLLRELKPNGPAHARLFLIKRISDKASTFGNMPDSLAKYTSEYHFLFDVIHRFHTCVDKSDHEVLMLLPNAVRRFVELYTYSRLPGVFRETVDHRAETLFGKENAKRILKVFHYFSHANSIDRLAGNNELIFDVEHAIKDLFSAIQERDPHHWNALLNAVDVNN